MRTLDSWTPLAGVLPLCEPQMLLEQAPSWDSNETASLLLTLNGPGMLEVEAKVNHYFDTIEIAELATQLSDSFYPHEIELLIEELRSIHAL